MRRIKTEDFEEENFKVIIKADLKGDDATTKKGVEEEAIHWSGASYWNSWWECIQDMILSGVWDKQNNQIQDKPEDKPDPSEIAYKEETNSSENKTEDRRENWGGNWQEVRQTWRICHGGGWEKEILVWK